MQVEKILLLLTSVLILGCSKIDRQDNDDDNLKSNTSNCNHAVTFGDIDICLPDIDGMTECYDLTKVKILTDKYEYVGNTVLAFYLNNETFKKVDILDQLVYDDYIKIYAAKSLKNKRISQSDLDKMADLFETGFLKENWEELKSKILKGHSNISLGRPVLLESYSPHKNIKTSVIIAKYEMNGYENVMVCTANIILIKNRMINLAYYRKYEDEASIKQTRAKNDYIVLLFLDENR